MRVPETPVSRYGLPVPPLLNTDDKFGYSSWKLALLSYIHNMLAKKERKEFSRVEFCDQREY